MIVVTPTLTGVTTPMLDTVAMAGLDDCQAAEAVTFCTVPSDSPTVAMNWLVCARVIEVAPATVTASTVSGEDGVVGVSDELQADVQTRVASAKAIRRD